MKNISIIEMEWEQVIQYMHSDDPEAVNLKVSQETYDNIQTHPIAKIKQLIDIILLQPNAVKNKEKGVK